MNELAALTGIGAHKPRPVGFKGVVEHDGWQVKTYLIDATDGAGSDAVFAAARATALPALAQAEGEILGLSSHRLAILTLHRGTLANWLLLNWWVGGSILRQKLFRSETATPFDFADISDAGLVACVWEFGVLDFERRAWMATMMAAEGPRPALYLAQRLSGTV